jgi:hypothetical protein
MVRLGQLLKTDGFWGLYGAVLMLACGPSQNFLWVFVLGVLFGLCWGFRRLGWEAELRPRERRLYWAILLLYSGLETWLQVSLQDVLFKVFPWRWVNSGEHFLAAAVLPILLLPLVNRYWSGSRGQFVLMVVGGVCLVGNLNELLEFATRLQIGVLAKGARWAQGPLYQDTMNDLLMNLLGGMVGASLFTWVKAAK